MSYSLRSQGPKHVRLLCPPPSPRICSNPRPSSQWCHPTISSSVTPFSSYPQSFPASGSFPVSWLFASEEDFPKIPRVKSFCLVTHCFIWQFLGRYFSFRGNCCAEKYLNPVLSRGWVLFFFLRLYFGLHQTDKQGEDLIRTFQITLNPVT